MAGPLPDHFRWLWYLVGLAGMALMVVGIVAILGSALELGILIPVVVGSAIVIGYVIVRFRRSVNEALAAAPSRQAGAVPPPGAGAVPPVAGPEATIPDPDGPVAGSPSSAPAPAEPASGPARTSRR